MDRWEIWERSLLRLVVVGCAGIRARSGVVSLEEERSRSRVRIAGGLKLTLLGEQELEGAIGTSTVGGDIKREDGGDVVGGEFAEVGWTVGLVWVLGGDLGDVVRELELAWGEVAWAAVTLVGGPFVVFELALGDEVPRGGDGGAGESSNGEEAFHVGWLYLADYSNFLVERV